jgi:hypothetical protein
MDNALGRSGVILLILLALGAFLPTGASADAGPPKRGFGLPTVPQVGGPQPDSQYGDPQPQIGCGESSLSIAKLSGSSFQSVQSDSCYWLSNGAAAAMAAITINMQIWVWSDAEYSWGVFNYGSPGSCNGCDNLVTSYYGYGLSAGRYKVTSQACEYPYAPMIAINGNCSITYVSYINLP